MTAHPLDRRLAEALPRNALYAVGGRVRDEFRARLDPSVPPPKDFDYVVTGLSIEALVARLRGVGRVNVVGASFAVVKLSALEGTADLALPRREHSTGSGHRDFAVESGPDITIEEDLGRRDFRMNMIARRISDDVIVDPFGGVADIEARRIDIVAPQTFVEDPLRLLRAAQFAARFGYELSDGARSAMTAAAKLVSTVSPERVCDELLKLFGTAGRPSVGLEILRTTGVLAELWPEIAEGIGVDQNEWHAYDVYRHNLETADAVPPGDATLRIAALLHDVGKPRTKDGPHFYRHEHVGADMAVEMLSALALSERDDCDRRALGARAHVRRRSGDGAESDPAFHQAHRPRAFEPALRAAPCRRHRQRSAQARAVQRTVRSARRASA